MSGAVAGRQDLAWLPGWRISELVRAREVSAVEVAGAALGRIEELDRRIHAFLTVDAEGAMEQARAVDRDLASGAEVGPMVGVPVSIKDQIFTKGVRTTAGSRAFKDHVPALDAPCVERLKKAGAIVVGKTNTPEFGLLWRTANLIAEETVNPWNADLTSGGSSGGAAASVAAGMTPVAVGADGAGSIRLPAAFCGVVGIHPSMGRVPRFGVIDGAIHFNGIGPLARDVRDAALAQWVMAGPDRRDPTCMIDWPADYTEGLDAGAGGLRFIWWNNTGSQPSSDPRVLARARAAAELLSGGRLPESDLGLEVDRFYIPFHCISSSDRYARVGQNLSAYDEPALRSLLTPGTRDRFAEGRAVTGAEYSRSMSARQLAIQKFEQAFAEYDLILSPTVGFTAPAIPRGDLQTRPQEISVFTFMINMTAVTAASVPCGEVDGLPVGLQIIGNRGQEATVLRACRALERLLPWSDRRPEV